MDIAALVISILALLFTTFSFWWMNCRTGSLHVGAPRSYAARGAADGKLVVELPFIFHNDGPVPRIVTNLRLLIHDDPDGRPLHFVATLKKLGKDEERALAVQFAVHGRQMLELICEFQREPGKLVFEARDYELELHARLGNSMQWKKLAAFPLRVQKSSLDTINTRLLAYDNHLD